MKPVGIYDIIRIDEFSATPKYQQLINAVLKGIEQERLKQNDVLPSINDLSFELDISRDTAEKGYRYLKKIGVLGSVPGKGYFIKSTALEQAYNVCLLFNKLSAHKKIIYDSMVAALGNNAAIDFYIYNNDFALFRKLLTNKTEDYTHFVIIPHFIEGGEKAHEVINTLPKHKLILLDKQVAGITGEYSAVYENFAKDIYKALENASERLSNYHTLKIIFPKSSYYPVEIVDGFNRFCQDYAFNYKVVSNIKEEEIHTGEVFISVMEDDLVKLIERLLLMNLKAGTDVGVVSYNETPIKKIILDGITTISTDFAEMGKMAARLIMQDSREHVEVPFKLTLRNSL
ncbi:MAG TPA: GntR family transcriptional regulator [Panacibacter sp.]|nr:GntR family transcriptional regulator [Panacibacter sp.]HNP45417.1 GntR family transcriptional regulator [Panacibacter sp.]